MHWETAYAPLTIKVLCYELLFKNKLYDSKRMYVGDTLQALRPDMCTILKDQSLLYAFMQHLKSRGAVYILQFCLDVGMNYVYPHCGDYFFLFSSFLSDIFSY